MRKGEKIISFIMLFVIGLSNVATPISYAAESGKVHIKLPSDKKTTTLATGTTLPQPDHGSVLAASTSLLTIGSQPLDTSPGNVSSAHKRIPVQMQQLAKKVYQTDEPVTIAVTNPDNESFTTAVKDISGKYASVPITETNNGTTTNVQLSPSNEVKPGAYVVTVTDQDGNTTTQDFSWGVLALNFDKSMYHPGETGDISMAVLNDKGDMVCDANVVLSIRYQVSSSEDILSTNNGKITVNSQCQKHDFSLQPDYEAHYRFGGVGMYSMQLTATTANGTHTISDSIQVKQEIPFDLQRVSATRIYPPNTYPMTFNVTAHQDFAGTVTETVPQDFTITPASQSGSQSYTGMQTMYLNGTDPTAQLQQALLATGVSTLMMPFQGNYPVTQGFGMQLTDPTLQAFYNHYGLAGHDGVDFGLPMNTPLSAVDEGDVVWSGPGDYGITIIIQHSWGRSYYGHLSSTAVRLATHVTKGQLIGYSGESGEATGPHLHFGIRPNKPDMTNGYYGKIDPLAYLPFGHTPESTASLGPTLSMANVLGASDSATASSSGQAATPTPTPLLSAIPSATPSGVAPSVSPVETSIAKPTPVQSLAVSPSASSGATPNNNFSVLDKEILTNEQLANSAQTQKVKVITWHVDLKKGESTTLGYAFQAPHVSPQFYLLGPVKFYAKGSDKVIFQEQRQWQIASDDVGVEWYQNTSGNKWNGYSWQYRKKITIDHTKVSTTPSEPTTTFLDSADASENTGFYNQVTSSSVDCTKSETGPCSYKFSAGSTAALAGLGKDNAIQDSGTRISLWVNYATLPTNTGTGYDAVIALFTTGESTYLYEVDVTWQGKVCLGSGTGNCGTATMTAGTWHRISLSFILTNATNKTYNADLYLDGVLQASGTNLVWGGTNSSNLEFGTLSSGSGPANNVVVNFDDVYTDQGSDLSDPGAIHITAKRPFANGTSASFGTQIGSGGSGYGSGHAPQENERPLSTTNGWSTTSTSATEEYTIESASTGDVDLTGDTLIADDAWIYAKDTSSCTGTLINNGITSSISLTSTTTYFHDYNSISSYPAGGTDVGITTCSAAGTTSLYETGVQFAYTTSAPTPLSNFPVLVSLTDTSLNAHSSTGTDILFTDSTGRTLLPFELESYSSGTLVAWVKISSLSSTTDTIIYMYYGNPSAASQANENGTWNSNYAAVWHLSDNAANTTVNDSTTNSFNGTSARNTSAIHTTGKIDGAFTFNGTSDFVKKSNVSGLNSISNVTVSAWVNTSTAAEQVFSSGNASSNGYELLLSGSDVCVWSGSNICSTTNVANGSWHFIAGTWDGSNASVYADGSQVKQTAATITNSTIDNQIGAKCTAAGSTSCSSFFNGTIDEVEVSNVALAPGWITTEYNNQSSPSTFITVNSTEESDIYAPTLNKLMRHGQWFDSTGTKQPFTY